MSLVMALPPIGVESVNMTTPQPQTAWLQVTRGMKRNRRCYLHVKITDVNVPVTTSKELLIIFVIKCFCIAKKGAG